MANKIYLKSYLIKTIIVITVFLLLFLILNHLEYNTYKKNFNNKINALIEYIEKENKNINKEEIIKILNDNSTNNTFLEKYGINIKKDSIVIENDKVNMTYSILKETIIILFTILLIGIFLKYNKKKDKEIKKITKCIEEINKKNYFFDIDNISEDELSILKNEIYKTTIMLKEQAENNLKDKVNLKISLEDISHQLKTPLTSIIIMLDTLNEDPNLDIDTRTMFIRNIKREITNINFLVNSLLKLSKFDANTVKLLKENTTLNDIIKKSIENVSNLSDLKNIKIDVNSSKNIKLYCDKKWQVEALTNIIKNSLEHSQNNSKIEIKLSETNLYKQINIKDYGSGISEKDLPHIFERFYKVENSSKESVGIGLALAKTIIEREEGKIWVKSEIGKYTEFIIKYYGIIK